MRISDWSSDVCSSDLGRAERHAIDNDKCLQVVYRLRPRLTNGGEGDRPDINLGRIAAGLTRCRRYCGNPLFQRIDVPITREKNYTIRLLACERQRLGPARGIIERSGIWKAQKTEERRVG